MQPRPAPQGDDLVTEMIGTSFPTLMGMTAAEAAAHAYDSRTAQGFLSIQKVRYSHEAMADAIIAEPSITQNKLAKIFDRTPGWISVVMNSDAFKAFLARRKGEIVDPMLTISVRERFETLVVKSTEVLLEKLSKPIDEIADSTALKAAEIGAKALGIGGNAAPPPAPPAGHLTMLAERLLGLQTSARKGMIYEEIQDAEIREVRGAEASDGCETVPAAVPAGDAQGQEGLSP